MSRVTFRIGRKGVVRGVFVSELYDESELESLDTLESFIEKENSELFNKLLKDEIKGDVDYSECTAMHAADGAYMELIDDTTNTTILLKIANMDHDGNDLYLESCYNAETDECVIDMNNDAVIKELLLAVADFENPDIVIDGDTVSFNESDRLWCDMTLDKAIETLGIEDKYSKDTLDKIKNGSVYELDDGELNRINNEVSEIEHAELMLSKIVNDNTGKIILIGVDDCGGVNKIEELDKIDTDKLAYGLIINIGLLEGAEDSDNEDASLLEDVFNTLGL
jgi:hypothetical protein